MRAVAPKGADADERALRRDLVRILAATSANFYTKEPEGDRLHRDRWRERIRRTKDVWNLRYMPKAIHLANHHPVPWAPDAATRWPALVSVLNALRDSRGEVGVAWEALFAREVLPASWFEDPGRRFWCAGCDGTGDGIWRDAQMLACPCAGLHRVEPRTFLDLVSWASLGKDTIGRAEETAREASRRILRWGIGSTAQSIVWRVAHPSELYAATTPPHVVGYDKFARGVRLSPIACEIGAPAKRFIRWDDAYLEAVNRTWSKAQRGFGWYCGIVAGYCACWHDERPNPYVPMRELLDLGVVLDAITDVAIVLSLAPIGGPRA